MHKIFPGVPPPGISRTRKRNGSKKRKKKKKKLKKIKKNKKIYQFYYPWPYAAIMNSFVFNSDAGQG